MYLSSFLLLGGMLAPLAIATTTATTTTSALPTALPSLVSQIPSCAVPCWNKVKTEIGCDAGNFGCLCEFDGELVVKMGICTRLSDCKDKETSDAVGIVGSVCDAYKQSSGDAVSSASSIITAAIGKATATASSQPTSTNFANPMGHSIEAVLVTAAAAVLL
ncbi:Putative extracellular membrane protein, CFEM [Colletotrichum destructivum]|uniref:Extracellular membrane protein, CFEM n=1 Tax=Colletotrichum destructivum TaxID=34406 RepID=A0AAX4HVZ7_9PEZI|nr:Putative extracellular membrane protein, CFEM [Colletotrichum destructivum]